MADRFRQTLEGDSPSAIIQIPYNPRVSKLGPPFRSLRLYNALHKMYLEANKKNLKTNPAFVKFTELRDATPREGIRVVKDSTKTYRRKKLKALRTKCDPHLKTSWELKNALENRFRTFGTTVVVTKQSNNKTFTKADQAYTCRNFYYELLFYWAVPFYLSLGQLIDLLFRQRGNIRAPHKELDALTRYAYSSHTASCMLRAPPETAECVFHNALHKM